MWSKVKGLSRMSLLSPTYCLRRAVRKCFKNFSSNSSQSKTMPPEKHVFKSQSACIFTNLALEDWLYENADLETKSYLLLWRNKPTVVIGRHQNPWIECNVPEIWKQDISLVRRKSGGGTVYHDTGNLNCSILTNRKLYNRKENLKLIIGAVESRWEIPLIINNRDDIMLEGLYKISGTAAKLGGKRSYHHFTLLFDADLTQIAQLLTSPVRGADSKATASVPAPIKNLSDFDSSINFDSLTEAIAKQFIGRDSSTHNQTITAIFPTEAHFPGITKKIQELKDSDWIFGRTPKFSICRVFVISSDKLSGNKINLLTLKIIVLIDKGKIDDLEVICSGVTESSVLDLVKRIQNYLLGKRLYSREIIMSKTEGKSDNVISECILELKNYIDDIPDIDQRQVDWVIECFKSVFSFS